MKVKKRKVNSDVKLDDDLYEEQKEPKQLSSSILNPSSSSADEKEEWDQVFLHDGKSNTDEYDNEEIIDNNNTSSIETNNSDLTSSSSPPPSIRGPRHYYDDLTEFLSSINSNDNDTVILGLIRFISQVKSEHSYNVPYLLPLYLYSSPECIEITRLLDRTSSTYQIQARTIDVITIIITPHLYIPLSQSSTNQSFVYPSHVRVPPILQPTTRNTLLIALIRRLLRNHLRSITQLYRVDDNRLVAAPLRLLHQLLLYSSIITKEVVNKFPFDNKSFLTVPYRPYINKNNPSVVSKKSKKNGKDELTATTATGGYTSALKARQLFIDIILTLLSTNDADTISNILSVKGYITSILKHLHLDPLLTITRVLESFNQYVIKQSSLTPTVKFGLFNSYVLEMICKVFEFDESINNQSNTYNSNASKLNINIETSISSLAFNHESLTVRSSLVHSFLESLVSCIYTNHAWSIKHHSYTNWSLHKSVLTHLLNNLSPTLHTSHLQLTVTILNSFPSLYPNYLQHISVAFDARHSERWYRNMSFLFNIWCVPIDSAHILFLLQERSNSANNVTHQISSYLFPYTLTKPVLSSALSHPHPYVCSFVCQLLVALLERYNKIKLIIKNGSNIGRSGNSEEDVWKYWSEVEKWMIGMIPDVISVYNRRLKLLSKKEALNNPTEKENKVERSTEVAKSLESNTAIDKSSHLSIPALTLDDKSLIFSRLLDVLTIYQSTFPKEFIISKIDLWKLITFPISSHDSTLKIINLLKVSPVSISRICRYSFKQSQSDSSNNPTYQPHSYFGHLLQYFIQIKDIFSISNQTSSTSAVSSLYRSVTEYLLDIILLVISKQESTDVNLEYSNLTSTQSSLYLSELIEWLSSLTSSTAAYFEHLVCHYSTLNNTFTQSVLPPSISPLLALSVSPRYSFPTISSSTITDEVITLICLMLSCSILNNTQSSEWVLSISSATVAGLKEKEKKRKERSEEIEETEAVLTSASTANSISKEVDENGSESVSKVKREFLMDLIENERFLAVQSLAVIYHEEQQSIKSYSHVTSSTRTTTTDQLSKSLTLMSSNKKKRSKSKNVIPPSNIQSAQFSLFSRLCSYSSSIQSEMDKELFSVLITTFSQPNLFNTFTLYILTTSSFRSIFSLPSFHSSLNALSSSSTDSTDTNRPLLSLLRFFSPSIQFQQLSNKTEGDLEYLFTAKSPFPVIYSIDYISSLSNYRQINLLVQFITGLLKYLDALATGIGKDKDDTNIVRVMNDFLVIMHNLIFSTSSVPSDIHHRIKLLLTSTCSGATILHYFLSPLSDGKNLYTVSILFTPLISDVLQSSAKYDVSIVNTYLKPYCNKIVHSCCDVLSKQCNKQMIYQISLPLQLKLLQVWIPFLNSSQLSDISLALTTSTAPTILSVEKSDDNWFYLLIHYPDLFFELLSHSPNQTINRLSNIISHLSISESESFDNLILKLINFNPETVYHLPTNFFSFCLDNITPTRLKLLVLLLQSSANINYINIFSTVLIEEIVISRSNQLSINSYLQYLPLFATYLKATAHLSPQLLNASHTSLISSLLTLLNSIVSSFFDYSIDEKVISHMNRSSFEQFFLSVISSLILMKAISIENREALLKKCLIDDLNDSSSAMKETKKAKKSKKLVLNSRKFHVSLLLLTHIRDQIEQGEAAEDNDDHGELQDERSLFFFRILQTLPRLFKLNTKKDEDSVDIAEEDIKFESELLSVLLVLLRENLLFPHQHLTTITSNSSIVSPFPSLLQNIECFDPNLFLSCTGIDITSIVSQSNENDLVGVLNIFFTSALRYRFHHAHVMKIFYLLIQLPLNIKEKKSITTFLTLSPDQIVDATIPTFKSTNLSLAALPFLLSPQVLFDLIVSHSQFLKTLLPTFSSTYSSPSFSIDPDVENQQYILLVILNLLFLFPSSLRPSLPLSSSSTQNFLSLLFAIYSGSYSVIDRLILILISRIEDGNNIEQTKKKKKENLPTPSLSSLVGNWRRKWGEAGKTVLLNRMKKDQEKERIGATDNNQSTVQINPINDEESIKLDDDGSWIYSQLSIQKLSSGPILSTIPFHTTQFQTNAYISLNEEKEEVKEEIATPISSSSESRNVTSTPILSFRSELAKHYHPLHILPFIISFMRDNLVDVRKLIELGVLSYSVLCMSHVQFEIRQLAYQLMAQFYLLMEQMKEKEVSQLKDNNENNNSDMSIDDNSEKFINYSDKKRTRHLHFFTFREQAQVFALLMSLKNSITRPNQHLSPLIATFISRSLIILLKPHHRLYKLINHFIMARPVIDLTDIPLFYQLFTSGSMDYKHQRGWLLQLIADGYNHVRDYHLLVRRHVVPLLLSYHDSRLADRYMRVMIASIITRLSVDTDIPIDGEEDISVGRGSSVGLVSLIKRHSIFAWVRGIISNQQLDVHVILPIIQLVSVLIKQLNMKIPDQFTPLTEVELMYMINNKSHLKNKKKIDLRTYKTVNGSSNYDMEDAGDRMEEDILPEEKHLENEYDDTTEENQMKSTIEKSDQSNNDSGGNTSEEEGEEVDSEDDGENDNSLDKVRSVISLRQRRYLMSEQLSLLFRSLQERISRFISSIIDKTNQLKISNLNKDDRKKELPFDEVNKQFISPGMLSFHSSNDSSSTLGSESQLITFLLQTLSETQLLAQKLRHASGIDQLKPSHTSYLLSYPNLTFPLNAELQNFLSVLKFLPSAENESCIYQIIINSTFLSFHGNNDTRFKLSKSILDISIWCSDYLFKLYSTRVKQGNSIFRSLSQFINWLNILIEQIDGLSEYILTGDQTSRFLQKYFRFYTLLYSDQSSSTYLIINSLLCNLDKTLPFDNRLLARITRLEGQMKDSNISSLNSFSQYRAYTQVVSNSIYNVHDSDEKKKKKEKKNKSQPDTPNESNIFLIAPYSSQLTFQQFLSLYFQDILPLSLFTFKPQSILTSDQLSSLVLPEHAKYYISTIKEKVKEKEEKWIKQFL